MKLPTKFEKAKVLEFNPSKKYIVLLDQKQYSLEEGNHIGKWLQVEGVTNITLMINTANDIRIIEL